ncbi:MAG TPA: hypothetical protein VGI70_08240 [Polyangiales bacterium]
MSASQDELKLIDADPGRVAFYASQNVTVTVWCGATDISLVERLRVVSKRVREQYPQGGSAIHIVRAGVPLPGSDVREQLVKLSNEDALWLAAVGVVIGGSGFWASTMRSVITALRVVASREYEMRIHGSLEEVIGWLP